MNLPAGSRAMISHQGSPFFPINPCVMCFSRSLVCVHTDPYSQRNMGDLSALSNITSRRSKPPSDHQPSAMPLCNTVCTSSAVKHRRGGRGYHLHWIGQFKGGSQTGLTSHQCSVGHTSVHLTSVGNTPKILELNAMHLHCL